jgi:hypothetical protein
MHNRNFEYQPEAWQISDEQHIPFGTLFVNVSHNPSIILTNLSFVGIKTSKHSQALETPSSMLSSIISRSALIYTS